MWQGKSYAAGRQLDTFQCRVEHSPRAAPFTAIGGAGPPSGPPEQDSLPAPHSAPPEETRCKEDLEKAEDILCTRCQNFWRDVNSLGEMGGLKKISKLVDT